MRSRKNLTGGPGAGAPKPSNRFIAIEQGTSPLIAELRARLSNQDLTPSFENTTIGNVEPDQDTLAPCQVSAEPTEYIGKPSSNS